MVGKKPEVIYNQEIISKWSSILVMPKIKCDFLKSVELDFETLSSY